MRKIAPLAFAALSAALLGGAAVAYAAPDGGPQRGAPVSRAESQARSDQMFDRIDTDHNGMLSQQELAAAGSGGRGPGAGNGSGVAPSGPGGGFGAMAMAKRADSNKDGAVSKAEFEAFSLARFDAADANHDGIMTPDERKAAMVERRDEMRAQRGAADR